MSLSEASSSRETCFVMVIVLNSTHHVNFDFLVILALISVYALVFQSVVFVKLCYSRFLASTHLMLLFGWPMATTCAWLGGSQNCTCAQAWYKRDAIWPDLHVE